MKFKNDICIIGGCGHVGLPLSLVFANAGKKVCIFDINLSILKEVANGRFPFKEDGGADSLAEAIGSGNLSFSKKADVISDSKYVILVIGTPVDEHLNPRFNDIKVVIDKYVDFFQDDQILILRSTIYPGISEKVALMFKKASKKVHVAFCPERIAEGKAIEELVSLPQIISGFSSESIRQARELFETIAPETIELKPIEAELAKLFTNVWRYISFSISNQFLMIADDYDIDFYKIYHAMTHNYPRASHFPKAGFAAGPCLFKDTMQLAAFSNNNFFLGHAAMLINEGLPNFIISKLKKRYSIADKVIGILGMAFKANSDDKRESLSYKLKKNLELECSNVLCSDIYIKDISFVSTKDLLTRVDIMILGSPHDEYKLLDISNIEVVDIWNFFEKGVFVK